MDKFKLGEQVIVINHFARPRVCIFRGEASDSEILSKRNPEDYYVVNKYGNDSSIMVHKTNVIPFTDFAQVLYL